MAVEGRDQSYTHLLVVFVLHFTRDTGSIASKLISKSDQRVSPKKYQPIDCLINEEFEIQCLRSATEDSVYIPFAFLHKYFEINGKIVDSKDGQQVFEWSHSYSRVYFPKHTYHENEAFLWFDNYNVEVRDRVRCVSAITGVPISSQWQSSGHSYAIQIAQFGLSHFSKHLSAGKPRVVALDSGDTLNRRTATYVVPEDAVLKRIESDDRPQHKVISVDGLNIIMNIKRKSVNDLTLSFDVKPLANFSLTAVLKAYSSSSSKEFSIVYTTSELDIWISNNEIIYGMGTQQKWKSLTRDLGVDLQKGLNIKEKKLGAKARNMQLIRLEMNGKALLANIRLQSSAHETYAKTAGDWFVANQESNGGFSINVNRKLSNGALQLKSGWYSAMAQGQAISLLIRLYTHTRNHKYLICAKNALNLFDIDSKDNGIRTKFMDKYVWFEEYPTTPSTYVLNGFIYSLFGLYDLSVSGNDSYCVKAGLLYRQGVESLEQMLPLFDSGSGSLYDLRHLGLGSAPNRARWDYHSTHINQLLFLNTIENKLIFQTTAKRWISYMKGYRAPHN
ncbi:unnamed protein product [Oppiella nova]|uniref:heparosan-N-sulfate-glucuronate 5-epimerase n=1 Tax=Oppiella nova TaxID=334625 RepID=A0A7R9LKY6_9ACAR|nr:unnamed protein product [Oppiella nova]CAG2164012.1 unnamed protein product [Oppiella nova]